MENNTRQLLLASVKKISENKTELSKAEMKWIVTSLEGTHSTLEFMSQMQTVLLLRCWS